MRIVKVTRESGDSFVAGKMTAMDEPGQAQVIGHYVSGGSRRSPLAMVLPVGPVLLQVTAAHGAMGAVSMNKEAGTQLKQVVMGLEVCGRGLEFVQSFFEPGQAIVVAVDKVDLAIRKLRRQGGQPFQGGIDGRLPRPQGAPAEIERVAVQDQRVHRGKTGPERLKAGEAFGTPREQVQIGDDQTARPCFLAAALFEV